MYCAQIFGHFIVEFDFTSILKNVLPVNLVDLCLFNIFVSSQHFFPKTKKQISANYLSGGGGCCIVRFNPTSFSKTCFSYKRNFLRTYS